MTHREAILDPTGQSDIPRVAALAPRIKDLSGVRLGLLDNSKANAALVLQTLAAQLRAQHHLGEVATFTKSYFGTPVEEDRAKEIAQSCEAVIAGVGDWGSCSAASLADGIVLERAGVPAVSICTEAFVVPARAMADVYGMPDFKFVTIPHPIASLNPEQIETNVRRVIPDVVRILSGE